MLPNLKIKIFADGANIESIKKLTSNNLIKGFTTNPSLMNNSGIKNYEEFAKDVLRVTNLPVSFEVISDDENEIYNQAKKISSWGDNIYVKIPITNTKGIFLGELIQKLQNENIKLNITAITNYGQVQQLKNFISKNSLIYLSIFAGRIADTGIDPINIFSQSINLFKNYNNLEFIWASPRELLNIFQANSIGCHIITVTDTILNKLNLIGKDLDEYSLETVKMFYNDAISAKLKI